MNTRKLYDRLAGFFIVLGGAAIIVSILAVFAFILSEVIPLFSKPSHGASQKIVSAPAVAGALGIGLDEHRRTAYAVFPEGVVKIFSADTGRTEKTFRIGAPVSSFAVLTSAKAFAVGGDDGVMRLFGVDYENTYPTDTRRNVSANITPVGEVPVATSALRRISFVRVDSESYAAAVYTADGRLFLIYGMEGEEEEDLFAPGDESEAVPVAAGVLSTELTGDIAGEKITSVVLAEHGAVLCAATTSGRILQWDVSEPDSPVFYGSENVAQDRSVNITMMGLVLGDRSVAMGDSSGRLSVWFRPLDEMKFRRVHELGTFESAIVLFSNSLRNRSFAVADSAGNIGVFHATTARRRLLIESGRSLSALAFAPKGNAIAAAGSDGSLNQWNIKDDYPEISFKAIFGPVWYEGYGSPIHMWQSTGGTDEFEPKISLAPIIFGTFKGAVYSLLFAVPVAVFAALCVSQFMHPSFGKIVKPAIEIMAGLPSVVIGFFAGLWLSPVLEKIFSALVIMPFFIIGFALLCLYFLKTASKSIRRFRPGTEYLLLIPSIFAAVMVSLWLNEPAERLFFQGDYKVWLAGLGLDFDQRNALVVGFAMGFAVIPIVFTIAEDSMSGVPKTLVAASLALGASRWQTAARVVVPSASPGILSAVVIGFGRAIGETMIVLMATGNTPLLDWNIFNGFRAMSANIAVELPEAPHGGGLYRLIFFTSLLLFLFTFCLNTVAEFIRGRLGRKYGSY